MALPINNSFQKKQFNNKKTKLHKTNEEITASQVRITGDDIDSRICSLREALSLSKELEVDLVEINSSANPPICRLIDYQKFLYDSKKKEKEKKKHQTKSVLKEIQISSNIGEHDMNFKVKNAIEFLKDGNKVKVSIMFKGREIIYKEQGEIALLKFSVGVEEFGRVEQLPKLEGKNMTMFIVPKKK